MYVHHCYCYYACILSLEEHASRILRSMHCTPSVLSEKQLYRKSTPDTRATPGYHAETRASPLLTVRRCVLAAPGLLPAGWQRALRWALVCMHPKP
jgi:hypothetical protein